MAKVEGVLSDVVHGIQEDTGLVSRIKDDAMNRHVPNLFIVVKVVDVMPPCCEAMVALPHVKHLASKYNKVGICSKIGLEVVVSRPPEVAPQIKIVVGDIQQLALIVVY